VSSEHARNGIGKASLP